MAENSENETNKVLQSMIDISADRLEGLRTQCATSAELTQQEIRSLETKLVKMFSELLITKAKLPERLPKGLPATGSELKQWLRIVGLSPDSLNIVLQRVTTLENLLDKNDEELRSILNNNPSIRDEEVNRLVRAMINLKKCRDCNNDGQKEPVDLFWDSWDRHDHAKHRTGASPRTHRAGGVRYHHKYQNRLNPDNVSGSVASSGIGSPTDSDNIIDKIIPGDGIISPEDFSASTISPPESPMVSKKNLSGVKKKSSTPPPKKKHLTHITVSNSPTVTVAPSSQQQNTNNNIEVVPLIKSKSHESQLLSSNQETNTLNQNTTNVTSSGTPTSITSVNNQNVNMTNVIVHQKPRSRLHTEPGLETSSHNQNNDLEKIPSLNSLSVPRSPANLTIISNINHVTSGGGTPHRFTKKFKVMSVCDLCKGQMFFGLKCKECKYRCHKHCETHVPATCAGSSSLQTNSYHDSDYGSPHQNYSYQQQQHFGGGKQKHNSQNSPIFGTGGLKVIRNQRPPGHHNYQGPDSSSAGSSCNSSSPSSPAILGLPLPHHSATLIASKKYTQFDFPDVHSNTSTGNHLLPTGGGITIETHPIGDQSTALPISPRPALTILHNKHQSNDSDKTASTDSDRTPVRLDSMEEKESVTWQTRQNSLSLKEWDIPYDDLHLLEKIGKGRFGTVHRALWHGDVAVKLLKEDYLDDERTLEAFKLEVATFKKTRHENVVLFMGACMKPPSLAIVTSLCKGNTLYTHIHLRKDKFNLNRTTLVAQQISQGMGYLHARDIVHKDLKTKNIFLENGKVIITDFGLFSATKLCYCEFGLGIPQGWLCYLAPELICRLQPFRPTDEDLPFSKASDVFAFGTVWYELLCGEFPFKSQSPEAIIWQVGRGMKQTLANLQASRDVKDILMLCWSFQADDRPDFAKLLTLLERLPKKRLARSPSHPVQLSRSAESVF